MLSTWTTFYPGEHEFQVFDIIPRRYWLMSVRTNRSRNRSFRLLRFSGTSVADPPLTEQRHEKERHRPKQSGAEVFAS